MKQQERSLFVLLTPCHLLLLQIFLLFRIWKKYRKKTLFCRWQPLPGMLY